MTRKIEALIAIIDEALIIIAFLLLGIYVARSAGLIDVSTAVAVASGVGGFIVLIAYLVIRAHSRRPAVGPEALIGMEGQVFEDLDPEGLILVEGEIWRARSKGGEKIPRGMKVRVIGVEGLTLIVEPYPPTSAEGAASRQLPFNVLSSNHFSGNDVSHNVLCTFRAD